MRWPSGSKHDAADIESGTVAPARLGSGTPDASTYLRGDNVWAVPSGGGGGEANTASNVGTAGVGFFKQKTGVNLEFKKINAGSTKVTVVDDTGNSEVVIDAHANNIVAASTDSRLSDARPPTAHKTSHENGGSDEINVAGLNGVLVDPQPPIIGAGGSQAVAGNDARLTDARTPTAHKTSHQDGGADEINVGGLTGVLADPQPPIIGGGAAQAVAGNDARLTDARTPTAHKTSHENGGADEISVTGLSGLLADNQTPATHDILTKHNGFPGGTSNFLRADGSFAAPTASVAAPFTGNIATGSFTIATGQFGIQGGQLALSSTARATIEGTGRLHVIGRL